MASDPFDRAFHRLTAEVGRQVDVADEHARLDLYRSLLTEEQWRVSLLECLKRERDPALATSVLADLLELLRPEDRYLAVAAAPDSGVSFLTTRADELAVLDVVAAEMVDDKTAVQKLLSGSDWLQRRAVGRVIVPGVLAELASGGRTRKVRAQAAERARSITRG